MKRALALLVLAIVACARQASVTVPTVTTAAPPTATYCTACVDPKRDALSRTRCPSTVVTERTDDVDGNASGDLWVRCKEAPNRLLYAIDGECGHYVGTFAPCFDGSDSFDVTQTNGWLDYRCTSQDGPSADGEPSPPIVTMRTFDGVEYVDGRSATRRACPR